MKLKPIWLIFGILSLSAIYANSAYNSTTPSTLSGLSTLSAADSAKGTYSHVYISENGNQGIYDWSPTASQSCPTPSYVAGDGSYICPNDSPSPSSGRWLRGPAFNANGGTLYTNPNSTTDLGAQINTLVSKLPLYTTSNGPTPTGTIIIPLTGQTVLFSTPAVINSPLVTVQCTGSGRLVYTGTGKAFFFNDSPTSYSGWGGFIGCNLFGTSAASVGVEDQEATYFRVQNVRISGFTGTNAIGLYLHNLAKWTENSRLNNVLIDNNSVCIQMDNDPADTGGGFVYAQWRDVTCQTLATGGGIGVNAVGNIVGTPSIHGDIGLRFVLTQGSTAMNINNGFWFGTSGNTNLTVHGELAGGATSANGIVVDASSQLQTIEHKWWNGPGITDTFTGSHIAFLQDNFGGSFGVATGTSTSRKFNFYPLGTNTPVWTLNFGNAGSTDQDFILPNWTGFFVVPSGYGTSGQVLTSQGSSTQPIWTTFNPTGSSTNTKFLYNCSNAVCGSPTIAQNATTMDVLASGPTSSPSYVFTFHYTDGGSVDHKNCMGASATGDIAFYGDGCSGGVNLVFATMSPNIKYSAAGIPLPTCNAGSDGKRAYVTDATAPTFHGAYTSGGTVHEWVYCNGSSWLDD